MKSLFGLQDTLEVVTDAVAELAENATEAQRVLHKDLKKKDCKASFCIQSAVDNANFDRIAHAESTKEAWDILVKYYEGDKKVKSIKLQTLRRQYELLQMGDSEKIAPYVSKIQNLVHLMKNYGESITNKMVIEKVMRTLAPHFDHVIVAIQESGNVHTMKIEDLVGSLEAHELKIIERRGVQESIQALQAQTLKNHGGSEKSKGKFDSSKKKKGPWSNSQKRKNGEKLESSKSGGGNSNQKNGKRFQDRKSVQCYNCEKWGHFAKDCWFNKGKGVAKDNEDDEAKMAQEDSDGEPLVLMATISEDCSDSETWFLDTGCSNHMTGHKAWLIKFDDTRRSKIRLADNRSLQAEEAGNMVIRRSNGSSAIIEDVLYVPSMKCNLLSVGQLIEKGFSVTMKNENLELFDASNKLVLRSPVSKNRTFKTLISSTEVQCLQTMVENKQSWLWHLRFGHLNFRSLNQLVSQGMVIGLPKFSMLKKLCEGCLVGKYPRNAFKSYLPMRSFCILEVVHSDVCGPFEDHTIGETGILCPL